jgi:transcriptional regulator with XRE-family HTH domain
MKAKQILSLARYLINSVLCTGRALLLSIIIIFAFWRKVNSISTLFSLFVEMYKVGGCELDILTKIMSLFDESEKSDFDLEKEIGLPRSTIYKWRKGVNKAYKNYVIQIADYFNVSVDYLLGRETPSNGLSDEERELLDLYKKLNATGKQKLLEYAEDLTGNTKYTEEYADGFEKRAAN